MQIGWVVDHLADLEADFRAIYHLDLADEQLSGPRVFALARRVFAYQSVMAARWEQLQQEGPTRPPSVSQEAPGAPGGGNGAQVVDLGAFRAQFPDLVSHTRVDE